MYEIINAIFYIVCASEIIVAGITMCMLIHNLRKDSRKLTHKNKKYFIKRLFRTEDEARYQ